MPVVLPSKIKILLALTGAVAALALCIARPAPAEASESNYCGGWLNGGADCQGAQRLLHQTLGWGDQHSVCVSVNWGFPVNCSAGPGVGVYSDRLPNNEWRYPYMKNNAAGSNFVHGIAYS
jgi:hypothetical protein